eukprot:3333696-Pyramimonas_sp.AAC.1
MWVRAPRISNSLGKRTKIALPKVLAVHSVMQPVKLRNRSAGRPCQRPNAHGEPGGNGWAPSAAELKPGRAVEGAGGDPD